MTPTSQMIIPLTETFGLHITFFTSGRIEICFALAGIFANRKFLVKAELSTRVTRKGLISQGSISVSFDIYLVQLRHGFAGSLGR